MKALFVFDTVLVKDNDNYYGMTLTYDFFKERYLSSYDEITVTTRAKEKSEIKGNLEGYKITNGKNVNVEPIEFYHEIPDVIINNKKIKKELTKKIKNNDKIIIRLPSILGIVACNICQRLKKQYLVEMVACAWDGYINHTNPFGKIIAPVIFLETRKCVKKAYKVLYVTNYFLQKRYPTKGKIISCSDVILKEPDKSVLNRRMTKINNMDKKNEIKLCTVANVGMKYKGHKYVIKAISKLNKKDHKYKYYLIGNGDQNRLKKYSKGKKVQDDVIFLGSLPHDKVFDVLDEIDIYIQPSLQEGLPRALLEAMSRACPAFGSNAGGIPELLDSNVIFKKKNVSKIISLLNNISEDKLIKEANRNYSFVFENYDYKSLINKRKKFYKED